MKLRLESMVVDVPDEIGQKVVGESVELTQYVYLDDWTYQLRAITVWSKEGSE